MTIEKWQTYEQVAVYVPGQFASTPGMEFVEKKQVTAGKSGATWEIDNKAVLEGEKVKHSPAYRPPPPLRNCRGAGHPPLGRMISGSANPVP